MKKSIKLKPLKAYAGFCDNKIGSGWNDIGIAKLVDVLDIFRTKTEAKKHFEYVVPVIIIPLTPRKGKKK